MEHRRPTPTKEGQLIGRAAERTGLSVRRLAAKAGISDARWRHIVNGYQPVGRGQTIPIVAPAETLARMARVVGVTPDELRKAGRADAAAELERQTQAPVSAVEALAEDIKAVLDDVDLTEEERFAIAEMLLEEFDRENAEIRERRRERMRSAVQIWRRARGAA